MNRQLGPEAAIDRLENGGASDDGLRISFDIITKDGRSHAYWMGDVGPEKFVSYMIGLSQHAAGLSGKLKVPENAVVESAQPIEALALAVSPGRSETEALLSIHLGTFSLHFAVGTNHIKQLCDRVGDMLTPINPKKKN